LKALSKVNISNKDRYIDGKTKDNFLLGKDKILFVFTDRISANDVLLAEAVPKKGVVQCLLSKFWFKFIEEKGIAKTHFSDQPNLEGALKGSVVWQRDGAIVIQNIQDVFRSDIKDRIIVAKKISKIAPLRFIIKGCTTEEVTEGIYSGFTNPESLFLWPGVEILARTEDVSGKVSASDAGNILEKWLLKNNLKSESFKLLEEMMIKSREVYKACAKFAIKKGVFVAEAKFEFGFDEKGKLFLVDEILNPDCARFWLKEDFENKKRDEFYDKRILLEWLRKMWWKKGSIPPPKLTNEVIEKISGRYETILKRIAQN